MQVTDKRIHQVKLELSVNESRTLRKAIDHYLTLCSQMNHTEEGYVEGQIDLETLRAMSSHLKLIEVSTVVEEIRD
jgi:hypothetical protein